MKKHDWFAANLFQPDMSIDDFYNAGITPANTEIKSKDEYRSNPKVVELFSSTGEFDEKAFEKAYNNALLTFNKYSTTEFNNKVLSEYEFDPAEWRAPIGSNKKDTTTYFELGRSNITNTAYGIETLGAISAPQLSMREIAQRNEVRDENGNKLGYTPNEKGGLFKGLTMPTLVLAQYDEDVYEGEELIHRKGDLKTDDEGNPYYEELGDRNIYGRDVLHYTDVLTDDLSKFNAYDFFDSDGIDKSIGGIAMKTTANLVPYLIPGFRWVWAGMNASLEIAKVLPVLGKAVNGIFGGTEDNELAKDLSKWEGYLGRFESSTSDATRQNPWSLETLGSLVSDITGQLYQQRVISSVPMLLQKAGFLDGKMINPKLGQEMALGYMALTSAKESYGEAINAGLNETTAGFMAVANMLALNGLMRTDYFRGTLFKGSFFDDDVLKGTAKKVAREIRNDNTLEGTASKELLAKIIKKYDNELRNTLEDYGGAMLREGLEEMMEEGVFDFSKGISEALNAVGIPVANKELNFGWSWQDVFTRYGMSFIGGAIGGGIFNASNNWNLKNQSDAVKALDDTALAKMAYLIAEGRGQELKDYYTKLYKKGQLGDANLSSSKFQTVIGIDNNNEIVAETAGKSQNEMVYNMLMNQIDYMESLISEEGMKIPRSVLETMAANNISPKSIDNHRLLRAQILNLSLVNGGYFNDINKLTTDIVKYRAELDSLVKKYTPTDKEAREGEKLTDNEEIKKVMDELNQLREKRDLMLSGEMNGFYVPRGLFVLDENTNKQFLDLSIEKFTEIMYGKNFSDLNDDEKKEVMKNHQDYLNTEGKRNMYRAYEIYNKLSERWAERFQQLGEELKDLKLDETHDKKSNLTLWIELAEKHDKLIDKRKEFESKETLTPQETEELSKTIDEIADLKQSIFRLKNTPSILLRGKADDETKLLELIGAQDASANSILAAAEYIRNLYRNYATTKTHVKAEDELKDFYRLIRKQNPISMRDRFINFLPEWSMDPNINPAGYYDEVDFDTNTDPENGLLISDSRINNTVQEVFVQKMQDLEESFGEWNTQKKLKEVLDYIKQHTRLNDDQALALVKSLLSNINRDGTRVFSLYDFYNEIEELRSQVSFSPIYDLLREFAAEYSNGAIDIATLLESEFNELAAKEKFSDYSIKDPRRREELEKIAQFLNAIKAVINGSYSGLNEASNKVRNSEQPQLAVIEDDGVYKLLMNDITDIQNRIRDILILDSINNAQKLRLHEEAEKNLKPKIISYLLEEGFVESFKTNFGGIDLKQIWKEVNDIDINPSFIDNANWNDFERIRIDFESRIYEEVNKLGKDSNVKSLVALFGKNLYKMQSTRVEPDTKVISGYDMALYLLDVFTIKSSDWHSRYVNVLDSFKTVDDKILAPVIGQEWAIRRNCCLAANVVEYNRFVDEMSKQAENDNNKFVQNKRKLYNISSVFGGAGTGKTAAISAITAEMLSFDGNNVEFVFIAPENRQVENLKRNVKKEGKSYNSKDFFEKYVKGLDKEMTYDKKEEKMNFGYTLNSDNIFTPGKTTKVIIIDESTLFNIAQWDALSKLAQREGAVIFALGDLKQNQASNEVTVYDSESKQSKKSQLNNGIEDFIGIRCPLLTTSLRAGNEAKFLNAVVLDQKLSSVLNNSEDAHSITDFDNIFNRENTNGFVLNYFDSPDGSQFVGEKITNRDEAGILLRRFASYPDVRIAYVTDIKGFTLPTDLAEKKTSKGDETITLFTNPGAIQGGEYDYIIIDKKWDTNSTFNLARDLYTLTQRSTKGSIIVDNGLSLALNVKSNPNPALIKNSAPTDEAVKEFVEMKLKSLNSISRIDLGFREYFTKSVEPEAESDVPSVNDFTETPVNKDNVSTPPPAVDNKPDSKPFTIENNPPPISIEDFSEPLEEPIYNPELNDNTPDENLEPEVHNEPVRTVGPNNSDSRGIEVKPLNWVRHPQNTREDVYYRWLTESTSLSYVRNKSEMKSFELSDEELEYLIPMISGAIKANESKDEYLSLILGDDIISTNHDVKDFLRNSTVELWIEQFDDEKDIIVARFLSFDANRNSLIIPISFVGKGLTGKYTGDFSIQRGPRFDKTKKNWVSLEELKQVLPGMHIMDTWGVYSFRYDFDTSEFGEYGAQFAFENNGKVMSFLIDNPYIMRMLDDSDIWIYGESPTYYDKEGNEYSYMWYHQNSEYTGQVGLEKFVSFEELFKFVYLRHLRYEGTNIPTGLLRTFNINTTVDQFEQEFLGTDEVILSNSAIPEEKSAFYSQMAQRRFQALHANTSKALLSHCINTLKGDSRLSKLVGKSLQHALQLTGKDGKPDKYKNFGLSFEIDGKQYVLKYNNGKYVLYEDIIGDKGYDHTIGNRVKEFNIKNNVFPIKEVFEYFGNKDFSNVMIVNTKTAKNGTKETSEISVNEQLYRTFSAVFTDLTHNPNILSELDSELKSTEEFKHGILTNVAGGNFHDNESSARKYIGTGQGYMIDVSTISYSEYLLDKSRIERGTTEEIERQSDARVTMEENIEMIIKLLKGLLDVNMIRPALKAFTSVAELLSFVNQKLIEKSEDWHYNQIIQDETGDFKLKKIDDKFLFIENLSRKFGLGEGAEALWFSPILKCGIFSVNSQIYRTFVNSDSNWDYSKFDSFNAFTEVLDSTNFEPGDPQMEGDLLSIRQYLHSTVTNDSYDDIDIVMEILEKYPKISSLVNKYLETRLLNGEC